MIGVSPAYFVSRFSNRFSPADVAAGLEDLHVLGFSGFQLEVFHRESLEAWVRTGAAQIRKKSSDLGLKAHQFVAHFMLEGFADRQGLVSDAGVEKMKGILEIMHLFDECRVVTVPLPAFDYQAALNRDDYLFLFERCAGKVSRLLTMVEDAGRRMALEVLPGAIVGGIDGFLRLCEHLGSDTLGLNFDTGHAWACKENLYLIPAKLGPRILGTHLCDNFGHENLSLRPWAGSIDWPLLVAALKTCGYNGPWDIEIICKPEDAAIEYGSGRKFIENLLNRS
jgi:sugar phosphate isomerase/epimerase